ncbi:NAD(P)-dependent oxidoreductase, partial [bacterium]
MSTGRSSCQKWRLAITNWVSTLKTATAANHHSMVRATRSPALLSRIPRPAHRPRKIHRLTNRRTRLHCREKEGAPGGALLFSLHRFFAGQDAIKFEAMPSNLTFPPRKVLITGARGQLARQLALAAPPATEIVALERADLDICDEVAVRSALETHRPDVVFNPAAYNLVDKAEGEGMRTALEINGLGPAVLAAACREVGAPLVHFSTDFVLDGHNDKPYAEDDKTGPLGVYGASKLCGENVVLAASPRNFAIRVCRLFGPIEGPTQKPAGNFPLLMLKLARERGKVRVVDDQIGSPSYTPDLARGVWELLEKVEGGLFHLSNAGEIS